MILFEDVSLKNAASVRLSVNVFRGKNKNKNFFSFCVRVKTVSSSSLLHEGRGGLQRKHTFLEILFVIFFYISHDEFVVNSECALKSVPLPLGPAPFVERVIFIYLFLHVERIVVRE